jgi:glutathione synthase/RimK-type ligase-like ATP-grasp enzyme
MILVCGGAADPVLGSLCTQLDNHGYAYRLVDPAVYPNDFRIDWTWRGADPDGYIAGSGWKLKLEDIKSVFLRYSPEDERIYRQPLESKIASAVRAEWDAGLVSLLDSLPCLVVNRPRSTLSTRSKLFQALHIRRCGLLTPRTLVTTDPDEARQFYEECRQQVIFKSISRMPSIVKMMDAEDLDRLPLLRHGPTQFQEFVSGNDIRVHTVGDDWIATRIHSTAVDYRYPGSGRQCVKMEPTILPSAVAKACLRLARKFRLVFTGIDLKETPGGDYYCFEVNSSPSFDYYELNREQRIASLLAGFLQNVVS